MRRTLAAADSSDVTWISVCWFPRKMDAGEVARIGFKAMMDGEGDVVAGWKNKITAAVASVTPAAMLAERHRKLAEPGTAKQ